MLASPDLQQPDQISAAQAPAAPVVLAEPDVAKLREQFESYATAKADEIEEQRLSWRYYYAIQFTEKQLKVYEGRGQPAITFDRVGRKIDGLVGVVRKLRTDPKAFPRT